MLHEKPVEVLPWALCVKNNSDGYVTGATETYIFHLNTFMFIVLGTKKGDPPP